MKYLKTDYEVRILETRKDLEDYLVFRKNNDEWVRSFICELGAVGIPNLPLFFEKNCENIKIMKDGYTVELGRLDYENSDNAECIKDTGIFLIFPSPTQNRLIVMPTRSIAFPSICKRAGDDCSTMFRMDEFPNKKVLPVNEKADRLTRDFRLYADDCKILVRDDKVSAVLSKAYAILPADELIAKLEAQLKEDHPDFSFSNGSVSHEFLMAEYLFNDDEMEESVRLRMNDAGADISTLKAGVRFSTSDVGLSKVYATLFCDIDGVRTSFGGGVALTHDGDATPDMFGERCAYLGTVFKECEERIERLGNTEIDNVGKVIAEIREKYTFLPKGVTDNVIADMNLRCPNGGTGIDVYLALNEIVQRHCEKEDYSPTQYLKMSEQVAKLMFLPFDKIDKGEPWEKL